MHELPAVTMKSFQILVVRELRKAGFEVGEPGTHRRTELPEPERGFVLEILAGVARPGWRRRALIVCRHQANPVSPEVVRDLDARLEEARAEVGLVFSTADFAAAALAAGRELGIALLRVIDGRLVFDASGWGPSGHYPSWLPAYLVQVVDLDPAGLARQRLLEAGRPDLLLDHLGPGSEPRRRDANGTTRGTTREADHDG